MNNLDENNIIFYNNNYNNNKIKENKDNTNSNDSKDYNSNIDMLLERGKFEKNSSQKQKEKTEIKTNDIISIKSISSEQSKISNKNENQEKVLINKVNKFSDLSTSQSTAFSINSIYYNINQVSKFNFQNDSDLREKTREFILQQVDKKNNPNITINKMTENSSKFLDIKSNMNLNIKKPIVRKKSENLTKSNILNKNENYNLIKRATIQNVENDFEKVLNISKSSQKININENKENENNIKKEEEKQEQKESKKTLPIVDTNTITKGKNSPRKRPVKKNESINTKDKTFYSKIHRLKTMKKRRANSIETKPEKEHKNNKVNYDKLISKNIEKNQKNLNNPEEYFEGFFNNIILYENEESNLNVDKDANKSNTFDN